MKDLLMIVVGKLLWFIGVIIFCITWPLWFPILALGLILEENGEENQMIKRVNAAAQNEYKKMLEDSIDEAVKEKDND